MTSSTSPTDYSPPPFTLRVATHIRYLGVFFTPMLNWKFHVTTLANRARSSIRALSVIGNSVRGISFLSWRKIFLAIIIPTLTYGSQVWFTDVRQKSLIETLQIAQNEGCRKIGGFFRTTPSDLMHVLTHIPPIRYRLRHLLRAAGSRLSRLPPSSAMRSHSFIQKSTLSPSHASPLPYLPRIAEVPSSFPIYVAPSSP